LSSINKIEVYYSLEESWERAVMKLSVLVNGLEETDLLYLKDSYTTSFEGNLWRLETEGRNNVYLILDRTLFHPKGGGQPTDKGVIFTHDLKVQVKKAILVKGIVIHWGKKLSNEEYTKCTIGEIQWKRRYQFMRRHTAGHLFDHCLTTVTGNPVETTDSWLDTPCYVGYSGRPPTPRQMKNAEKMANEMISKDATVKTENILRSELLHRAADAPNIDRLPVLESYRIVTIKGCSPIPCAGTHLKNLNEIGNFVVDEVRSTPTGFRVFYNIQQQ
jgi:alanyl-tRNA synthetase